MPNNDECSDWTIQSLKEYTDQRFRDANMAVEKATVAIDKRLEAVNEFRATLADQQKDYLTRNEYSRAHSDLVNQVANLSSRMDKREGETKGISDVWGWIFGAIGLLIGIGGMVITILSLKH